MSAVLSGSLLQGYAFQMEVVVRARQLGYTVEEVGMGCPLALVPLTGHCWVMQ